MIDMVFKDINYIKWTFRVRAYLWIYNLAYNVLSIRFKIEDICVINPIRLNWDYFNEEPTTATHVFFDT